NVVQNNFIGLNAAGTAKLGASGDCININSGATFNLVGTDGDGANDAAERNVLGGASFAGIAIYNNGTNNNVVAGNYVGTDVTGTVAIPDQWGVAIGVVGGGSPAFNRVGTNADGVADVEERNLISGNGGGGGCIVSRSPASRVP